MRNESWVQLTYSKHPEPAKHADHEQNYKQDSTFQFNNKNKCSISQFLVDIVIKLKTILGSN